MEPARFCQVCGASMPESPLDPGQAQPEGGAEQPLATLLYRALIGPLHTDYYLQQFARFDAAGKASITWHWPAFFATLGWLAFRRMWGEALVFAALSLTTALVLFGAMPLVYGTSPELLWVLLALYLLMLTMLPALWANAVYYRHCNRRVTQALVAAADIRQTCERLAAHSSNWRRGWIAAAVTALVWLVVGAVVAWWVAATGAALAPTVRTATVRPAASAPQPMASAAPTIAASASQPAAASSASAPVSAPAAMAPVPHAEPKVPAKPKAAASAVPASKQGKFIVAVGQFAQEQNASRAYDKLEAAGMPVHSNTVQTPTGTLQLIRVGPYKTRKDAGAAAQQIKALGLPAVVMKR